MPVKQIPNGYCQCGCGKRTVLAIRTYASRGIYRGQPLRYVLGHSGGRSKLPAPEPQRCACGCGQLTTVIGQTVRRYVTGHNSFYVGDRWLEIDCGYETACWIWQLGKDWDGYGRTRRDSRQVPAHRALYEEHVGPIPEGLQLDHLCRIPACVNPDHLEPVTLAENLRRGRIARGSAA